MLGPRWDRPAPEHPEKTNGVQRWSSGGTDPATEKRWAFWKRILKNFSKPFILGLEESHTVESGTQEGKLSVKSSFAQRGFQNRAHGLRVFMNLRVSGTSLPGHRHMQNGVVKEEFCPIQLEPQSLDLKQKHSSRPLTLGGLLFKAT